LNVKLYLNLDSLTESYSEVFHINGCRSFFLSLEWFHNLLEHSITDLDQLRIYGVESDDGVALGVLPLVQTKLAKGVLSPTSYQSLANYYTCNFAPMFRTGIDEEQAMNVLARRLWRDRGSWDMLQIRPVLRDSSAYDAVLRAFRKVGMVVQPYYCSGNWYLKTDGRSYSEYLETLPSVMRNTIARKRKGLEKLRSRVVVLTDGTGLDEAVNDYERIYNASWKVREAYPQFIRGLVRMTAQKGWLRLGLVYVDDEPVAAQIWIVHRGVAYIYKLAYDERYAKLSAGTVLTATLMQRVIDIDKVEVVDYLTGDDDYKRNWMSHRREFWGVLALNPTSVCGLVQIARHVGGRFGKRVLERVKP
jgi:hypothetical protein